MRATQRDIENLVAKEDAFPGSVTACDPGESYWHGQNLALGDWIAPSNCTGEPAGSRCEISAEMSGMSYIQALRAMELEHPQRFTGSEMDLPLFRYADCSLIRREHIQR